MNRILGLMSQTIPQSASCVPASLRDSEPCGFKDSNTRRRGFLSPGYHKVILSPSWRKRRVSERVSNRGREVERKREKGRGRGRKCQTVWPFLGNLATMSVWDINLQSSLDRNCTVICLQPHLTYHSFLPLNFFSPPFFLAHEFLIEPSSLLFYGTSSSDIYSVSAWLFFPPSSSPFWG